MRQKLQIYCISFVEYAIGYMMEVRMILMNFRLSIYALNAEQQKEILNLSKKIQNKIYINFWVYWKVMA